MRLVILLLALGAAGLAQPPSSRPPLVVPGAGWTRASSPAALGWSADKLAEARALSQKNGATAVVIVHRGVVVDQWGDVALPVNIRSARKSLLNALVGLAVDEGRLELDATLAALGIDDDDPRLTAEEKQATVADLLTSRSGVYHAAAYETLSAMTTRPARGSHPRGSFFYYNNWDFNALGTIVAHAFREPVFQTFARRIAAPLGMQDFSLDDTQNRLEPVSRHPAYLFRMSARDLARFGLLYAYDGEWGGRRILSREWVRASSTAHVDNARNDSRYGYLWWVAPARDPEQAFWAAGNGGQFIFVVPGWRLVVAHVVENDNLTERRAQGGDVTWGEFFAMVRVIGAAAPKR